MSGHTPGPWSITNDGAWFLVMAGGVAGQIVANVNPESCPDSRSAPAFRQMPGQANAHLIAAAPDLYAAADEALNVLIGCCIPAGGADDKAAIINAQASLRAAIAKAEGNS